MVELSETILRLRRALHVGDIVTQVQRIVHHVLPTVTEAVAVQRVQEAVEVDSLWTQLYMHAAGAPLHEESLVLEARSRAAIRLYQETVRLLQSALVPEHRTTIDLLLRMVDQQRDE